MSTKTVCGHCGVEIQPNIDNSYWLDDFDHLMCVDGEHRHEPSKLAKPVVTSGDCKVLAEVPDFLRGWAARIDKLALQRAAVNDMPHQQRFEGQASGLRGASRIVERLLAMPASGLESELSQAKVLLRKVQYESQQKPFVTSLEREIGEFLSKCHVKEERPCCEHVCKGHGIAVDAPTAPTVAVGKIGESLGLSENLHVILTVAAERDEFHCQRVDELKKQISTLTAERDDALSDRAGFYAQSEHYKRIALEHFDKLTAAEAEVDRLKATEARAGDIAAWLPNLAATLTTVPVPVIKQNIERMHRQLQAVLNPSVPPQTTAERSGDVK